MHAKPTAPSSSTVTLGAATANIDDSERHHSADICHGIQEHRQRSVGGICRPCNMTHLRERILLALVILLLLVGLVQLHFLLRDSLSNSEPCKRITGMQWVRNSKNCSHYTLCIDGQALTMPPCSVGYVWSNKGLRCVSVDSDLNDCFYTHSRGITSTASKDNELDPPVSPHDIWNIVEDKENLGQHELRNTHRGGKVKGDFILEEIPPVLNVDINLIDELFPSHPCIFITTETILPHPHACHLYYNCSLSPFDVLWNSLEPLTSECPYPLLFSITTRSCRPSAEVACGDRPEYKMSCKNQENNCDQSSCSSCESGQDSCVGLPNGVHPYPFHDWSPWFIVCKHGETVDQDECGQDEPIFSPLAHTCVSLEHVPKEYGGFQGSCRGRNNGYHLDETGVCHRFFYCKDEQHVSSGSCPEGSALDPRTLTCRDLAYVPPCGIIYEHTDSDVFCSEQPDGFYADLYGRCSLYYECRSQRLRAYLKCPIGSFNPRAQRCDTDLDFPAPCGVQANPCMARLDGLYADYESNCLAMVSCRNGFVSAIEPCSEGRVFDDRTKKCQKPEDTPSPCGIAPSCKGKVDRRYASVLKGCQHFLICANEVFSGYGSCALRDGGLFFNPDTGKCDFPHNICPPCGNKQNCRKKRHRDFEQL